MWCSTPPTTSWCAKALPAWCTMTTQGPTGALFPWEPRSLAVPQEPCNVTNCRPSKQFQPLRLPSRVLHLGPPTLQSLWESRGYRLPLFLTALSPRLPSQEKWCLCLCTSQERLRDGLETSPAGPSEWITVPTAQQKTGRAQRGRHGYPGWPPRSLIPWMRSLQTRSAFQKPATAIAAWKRHPLRPRARLMQPRSCQARTLHGHAGICMQVGCPPTGQGVEISAQVQGVIYLQTVCLPTRFCSWDRPFTTVSHGCGCDRACSSLTAC